MCSIVKIYENQMQAGQHEAFSYTVKDYKEAEGIFVSGNSEITLVFDKDNRIFINTYDLNTGLGSNPNKRAFMFNYELTGDMITGSIIKSGENGKVSIYLIMK